MDPIVNKCYFNLVGFTQENVDALYNAVKTNRWELYIESGVNSLTGNILLNAGERKRFSSIKKIIGEDFQVSKCGKIYNTQPILFTYLISVNNYTIEDVKQINHLASTAKSYIVKSNNEDDTLFLYIVYENYFKTENYIKEFLGDRFNVQYVSQDDPNSKLSRHYTKNSRYIYNKKQVRVSRNDLKVWEDKLHKSLYQKMFKSTGKEIITWVWAEQDFDYSHFTNYVETETGKNTIKHFINAMVDVKNVDFNKYWEKSKNNEYVFLFARCPPQKEHKKLLANIKKQRVGYIMKKQWMDIQWEVEKQRVIENAEKDLILKEQEDIVFLKEYEKELSITLNLQIEDIKKRIFPDQVIERLINEDYETIPGSDYEEEERLNAREWRYVAHKSGPLKRIEKLQEALEVQINQKKEQLKELRNTFIADAKNSNKGRFEWENTVNYVQDKPRIITVEMPIFDVVKVFPDENGYSQEHIPLWNRFYREEDIGR